MRRTLLAAVSTVVGLVLLLSFKTSASRPGRLAALSSTAATATAPPAAAGTSTAPAAPSAAPAPTTASGTTRAKTTVTARSVTGTAIDTPYGPVQLRVQLLGTRIVRITPVQLPSGQSRDDEINGYAVPILTSEALRAQSARIDTVSGATYTSDGYAQSLQSALDEAHA